MASKDSDQETKDTREQGSDDGEAKTAEGDKSEDQMVISVAGSAEDKKTDSKKSAEDETTVVAPAAKKQKTGTEHTSLTAAGSKVSSEQ